jgi:hypothetical protein
MFIRKTRIRTIAINEVAVILLFTVLTTTVASSFVIYPASAQVNNINTNKKSMDAAMAELAKLHIAAADQALMRGNTTAAFNQMNLAYLQFSMLQMKDMGTLNETEAMKFIQGAGIGSGIKTVPDNCIIIHGGILECRDILTGSYSLAK